MYQSMTIYILIGLPTYPDLFEKIENYARKLEQKYIEKGNL